LSLKADTVREGDKFQVCIAGNKYMLSDIAFKQETSRGKQNKVCTVGAAEAKFKLFGLAQGQL